MDGLAEEALQVVQPDGGRDPDAHHPEGELARSATRDGSHAEGLYTLLM